MTNKEKEISLTNIQPDDLNYFNSYDPLAFVIDQEDGKKSPQQQIKESLEQFAIES